MAISTCYLTNLLKESYILALSGSTQIVYLISPMIAGQTDFWNHTKDVDNLVTVMNVDKVDELKFIIQ